MNIDERNKRINQTIKETEELLKHVEIRYNNSIEYLNMEIEENKKLGNDVRANIPAIQHRDECLNRVMKLKDHITKLQGMIVK